MKDHWLCENNGLVLMITHPDYLCHRSLFSSNLKSGADVLIDTAVRIDWFQNSFKLLNDLIESPDFSLWTSAISLNNIEYIVSKIADREKAMALLGLIKDTFSIILFRRSVFLSAFTTVVHDFEHQIQIASAEQFSMDYIITRNVDHFIKSKIPVLTPTQFLQAKMIRRHGEIQRYQHQVIGHNYRMEAFQGAVLSTKIKYLPEWTEKRRANAALYNELLKDLKEVQTPAELQDVTSVYHPYVIKAENREGLQKHLQENGVASGLHYPVPLHLQAAYRSLGYQEGDFPAAVSSAKRILSLPMFPELTEGQIHEREISAS